MRLTLNLLGFTLFYLLLFSGPLDALDLSTLYDGLSAQLQHLNPFATPSEADFYNITTGDSIQLIEPIPEESLLPHRRQKVIRRTRALH